MYAKEKLYIHFGFLRLGRSSVITANITDGKNDATKYVSGKLSNSSKSPNGAIIEIAKAKTATPINSAIIFLFLRA